VAAASTTPRTWAVRRSLTLLRIFLVASALDPAEAEDELQTHRGTQFAPAVVDAFFRFLERSRPLEASRARPQTRARIAPST
jgi:hypothetical protein